MSHDPLERQRQLDVIRQSIVLDRPCPELAESATQMVFGEGDPMSPLVFVGEAPGAKEDLQGRPFIGAAGKFLDQMLETINLIRANIYITNIVKYRPPHNRDPSAVEKSLFLPYLQSQLEIIQPKLLITLGRHAANCFLPDLKIGLEHGTERIIKMQLKETTEKLRSVILLPLYHPAAALYNPRQRQTLLDDFSRIPHIMNTIKERT